MRWFRDGFCQAEAEDARRTGRDAYDLMNEKAADIPAGCYGMQCCFSDTMNFIDSGAIHMFRVTPWAHSASWAG